MQTNETTVEILNDLIKINNDRIAGYERAIKETKDLDVDLKALFEGMVKESEGYKQELVTKANEMSNDDMDDDSTTSGKIYRAWMDIKSTFTDSDRKTILDSCEFGEDAWRRAYKSSLDTTEPLEGNITTIIREQYDNQKKSHDLIKKYRDAQHAMD